MIDSFHLEAYGKSAVNYNRDLSTFPILKDILHKITGTDIYKSPTDMGINMVKDCIINEDIVNKACSQEVIRRYYNAKCDFKKDLTDEDTVDRIKLLMTELNINEKNRDVISPALNKSKKEKTNAISLKLPNGKIITGKRTNLLTAASSLIINAIKELNHIDDKVYLLSPAILEPIMKLKENTFFDKSYNLNLQEVLIALSICSVTNPIIEEAISSLEQLKGCEAHASYMVSNGDLSILKRLRINLTCEPVFQNDNILNS